MRRVVTEEDLTVLVNKVRGMAGKDRTVSPARRTSESLGCSSPYRSKWEEQMAYELMLEKRVGNIVAWGYETGTLKLSGRHIHRPDFTIWHKDGTVEMRQVKGYHKNIRAAMVGLKWAAQKHPWFTFTLWRRNGSGWESERVEG